MLSKFPAKNREFPCHGSAFYFLHVRARLSRPPSLEGFGGLSHRPVEALAEIDPPLASRLPRSLRPSRFMANRLAYQLVFFPP